MANAQPSWRSFREDDEPMCPAVMPWGAIPNLVLMNEQNRE